MSNDKQISLKLPQDLFNELEKIAKAKELPTSTLIRMVLKEYSVKQKG